ncbi:MAG TPA: ricin-type beta-trefoil lectin domain protein [Actinocrinis sp.]|nr:ricin-type beta-trefoil lectin domain protein [Actinocrinis sp.]
MPSRNVWRPLSGVCVALALLLGLVLALPVQAQAAAQPAFAAANQFHGVNWADPDDNFITGPNIPVGLSQSDSYQTTYSKATTILKGFQASGVNTVRFGINTATTSSSWWNSYTAAFDAATALGMNVVICPWLQGGSIGDTTAFYQMWTTVVNKYGSSSNFYFDIMNEPWMSDSQILSTAETWLSTYPSVPRGRVIVPGTSGDADLCAVGQDSALNGTLLSIHLYSMFGDSHTYEQDWINDFKNHLCGYSSRAVLTEFGVPMNTGVNYDGPRDGTNDLSYLYGITDTVRALGMGSILWTGVKQTTQTTGPGPCETGSCAITTLNSDGTVSIENQSGLDRVQWGWGTGTNPGPPRGFESANSARCLDDPGFNTASGTALDIWDCNGGTNQQWTYLPNGEVQVLGKCLDAPGSAAQGTQTDIADCSGGAGQLWTLKGDGTVVNRASGLCLDVTANATANGSSVEVWGCNGGANQRWDLPAPPSGPITAGVGSGLCIDDNAGSTANGTKVQIWTCNASPAQDWSVVSDGSLRVLGTCMDVTGGGTANGTLVQLYTCNGTPAQQWTAGANGSLVNRGSGRCLDDTAASTSNGTQLEIWDCNGGANQRWTVPSL